MFFSTLGIEVDADRWVTMHYFVISKQKLMQKRKGVSLIELIIVLAIIGIVILLASSSHLFGLNTFSMSQEKSKNQFEVRMATDFVAKKLRYAGSIRMLSSEQTMAPTTGNYIYLTGGTLYCNEGGLQIPIPGTEGVIDFTFHQPSRPKICHLPLEK